MSFTVRYGQAGDRVWGVDGQSRRALPVLCEASRLPRPPEACAIPFSRTAQPCGRGTPLCQGCASGLRGRPGLRATAPRPTHGEGARCGTSGGAAGAKAPVAAPETIARERHALMHPLVPCIAMVRAIRHQRKTATHEAVRQGPHRKAHRKQRRRPEKSASRGQPTAGQHATGLQPQTPVARGQEGGRTIRVPPPASHTPASPPAGGNAWCGSPTRPPSPALTRSQRPRALPPRLHPPRRWRDGVRQQSSSASDTPGREQNGIAR